MAEDPFVKAGEFQNKALIETGNRRFCEYGYLETEVKPTASLLPLPSSSSRGLALPPAWNLLLHYVSRPG